jgi:hypothetical protein
MVHIESARVEQSKDNDSVVIAIETTESLLKHERTAWAGIVDLAFRVEGNTCYDAKGTSGQFPFGGVRLTLADEANDRGRYVSKWQIPLRRRFEVSGTPYCYDLTDKKKYDLTVKVVPVGTWLLFGGVRSNELQVPYVRGE